MGLIIGVDRGYQANQVRLEDAGAIVRWWYYLPRGPIFVPRHHRWV